MSPIASIFIDETWASTNMARRDSRAPRGERLRAAIPHGHWNATPLVAGLRNRGIVAPMVLDGPINGELFQVSRAAAMRTVGELWGTIRQIINTFTPQKCANHFAPAGYVPD